MRKPVDVDAQVMRELRAKHATHRALLAKMRKLRGPQRRRKLGSNVRTMGRMIRCCNRHPSNSRRMAQAIAALGELARQPDRVSAYNHAQRLGPKSKSVVKRLNYEEAY